MAPSGELRSSGVFAGKTVWSTPERLRGEVLTTRCYTNLRLPLPLPLQLRYYLSPSCCCIIINFCFSMSVSPKKGSSSASVRSRSAVSWQWKAVEEPEAGGGVTCGLRRRMWSVASGCWGWIPWNGDLASSGHESVMCRIFFCGSLRAFGAYIHTWYKLLLLLLLLLLFLFYYYPRYQGSREIWKKIIENDRNGHYSGQSS